MNAIRTFEDLDNLHSLYVDQWDWEKTIREEDRNISYLKDTVKKIYDSLRKVEHLVYERFPHITPTLPEEITFIYAEDLSRQYPDLTPKEREAEATRKYGAIFLIGIGATSATANHTTAAHPTMTTGAQSTKQDMPDSTATSSSGTMC